jgi:predicted ATPase
MSNYSFSLKGIGIENFKAFEKYQYFEISPLTIITGPNNSGKSALIAALDILSKSDFLSNLNSLKENFEIGEFAQVLNANSSSKELRFLLDFKCFEANPWVPSSYVFLNAIDDFKLFLIYSYTEFDESILKGVEIIIEDEVRVTIKYTDEIDSQSSIQSSFIDFSFFEEIFLSKRLELLKKYPISTYPTKFSFVDDYSGEIINPEIINKIPKLLELENEIRKELNQISKKKTYHSFPISIEDVVEKITVRCSNVPDWHEETASYDDHYYYRFSESINRFLDHPLDWYEYDEDYEKIFTSSFKKFTESLKKELLSMLNMAKEEIQNTFKIEALRASSQRLFEYRDKNIPLTRDIISFAKIGDKEEVDFFRKWTGERGFNLFEDFKVDFVNGIGYRFQVFRDRTWLDISDLGFGTRQLIPVILGIFSHISTNYRRGSKREANNMLLIEEPESNLHPKFQSLLADLFVEAVSISKQPLIIETHSEYLIRKLQYLVAKQEILPESIAIHYIGDDTGKGRDIFKINIDKDGSLDRSFGPGFFDEATNWKFELMRIKHEQKN